MVGPHLWHETDEPYLVVGASGVISDANPAACRVLGMDRVALVGSLLADILIVDFAQSASEARGAWPARPLADCAGPSQSSFAPNVCFARIASGTQRFCLRRLKRGSNASHSHLFRLVPIGQVVVSTDIATSAEGWWHWRAQDRRLEVAPRFFVSLGYDADLSAELSGEPELFLQLMLDSDRERVFKAVLAHIKRREVLDVEFRAVHLSLGMRSYRLKGQAFREQATGRVQRISGLLIDVTEAKVLSDHRLEKVGTEKSFGLFVRIGNDGRILDVNDEACRTFGLERSAVVGRPWASILKPTQDHGDFSSSGPRLGLRDFFCDAMSGRRLFLRGILAPVRDVFGNAVGLEFSGFDVTESKRDEEALKTEVELRRATFEQAASIILTTDASGLIVSINDFGLRRLGYQEHELVGQKTPSVFVARISEENGDEQTSAVQRPTALMSWLETLKPGEKATREVIFMCRWGEQFPALMSVARVNMAQDSSGGGFTLVAQDLSELVRSERIKSDIVGVVSHELRTPLSNVSGALRLIRLQAPPEFSAMDQLNDLIGVAERNVERMNALIHDLLDLQNLEGDVSRDQDKSTDLQKVVQAGIDTVSLLCAEKNVSLSLSAAEGLFLVRGSFGRLLQVLTNLLSNAVKFSPADSCVEVSLFRRGEDALVSVRDFGPGVPPGFSRRLFKKFARFEGAHSNIQSGTGLGLSIAKSIIDQYGGKIGFRNLEQEGGGSEFYFSLPLVEQGQDGVSIERAKSSAATILIVEDDPDISDLVASAVEAMGFASVRASSVAQAKQALQTQIIDTVTLDLVMPDNHGFALMEWMQAEPHCENIPVIVVSGHSAASKAVGEMGLFRSVENAANRFGLSGSRLGGTHESFPENVMAWVEKPIKTHVLGAFLRDALEMRAQRTVAYLGPTGGRSLVFLRGVCSRLASVVVLQTLDEALSYLSCHPCSTLVVVDPSEAVVETLRSMRSRFARSLIVIQWYVEVQDSSSSLARIDEMSEGVGIGGERAVAVRFLRVSGTHWAAAAFFQHWLGQGRALVAS